MEELLENVVSQLEMIRMGLTWMTIVISIGFICLIIKDKM